MKYQTINAGDHFGRLETLERIKIGRRIAWICKGFYTIQRMGVITWLSKQFNFR